MKNNALKFITCFLTFLAPAAQAGDKVKHIPGVFIGSTHISGEAKFTFGVEYEYKMIQKWGVVVLYERTNRAHNGDGTAVALVSLYYHPTKNVRLGGGYGVERIGGAHPHNENLYRITSAYDFHVGDYGIAPTIAIDFVDDKEAIIVGLAITRPF